MNKPLRIAMLIAAKNFRDEEYFIPKGIFERVGGAVVTTVSSRAGKILGYLGGETEATKNVAQLRTDDFDALVLVGGAGAKEYFDNPEVHALLRNFAEAHKITAAICISPVTLAKAGILRGKRATVWSEPLNQLGPQTLQANGAQYTGAVVEVDEKIITANGPEAATEFAEKILQALSIQKA